MSGQIFSFGPFVLDPGRGVLERSTGPRQERGERRLGDQKRRSADDVGSTGIVGEYPRLASGQRC